MTEHNEKREKQRFLCMLTSLMSPVLVIFILAFIFPLKSAEAFFCSPQKKSTVFADIERVELYVNISPKFYEEFAKCKGMEEQCVKNKYSKYPDFAARKDKHLRLILDAVRNYPTPLHRAALTEAFDKELTEAILPFVTPRNASCSVPPIAVISEEVAADTTELIERLTRPRSLIAIVKMDVISNSTPPIAILSFSFYRPEVQHFNLNLQAIGNTTAIPLNLEEDKIKALVTDFVSKSLGGFKLVMVP